MQPSGERSRGAAEAAFLIGLAVWLIAMVWSYFRPSLWVLDVVVVPLMWVFAVGGITAMAVGAMFSARRSMITGAGLVVVLLLTGVVGAWWQASPRVWFETHRALYEQALHTDPGDDYYGAPLPLHLRFLSVGGHVSGRKDTRFFPQWIGTPDDAGGYLYSPSGSPAGYDMYGQVCSDPTALGGDWWMCGLKSDAQG
ncbi:MAG: hypothetical protein QM774_06565 [Gordonia sp. (in: high G+C Gram-positive bacteria)]|uniref:hypothetical protein n=1 Tax=Gordonia sp. (in: high G+C Gram-positive bacteria) TaxID=84139 RepID=UPI0039E64A76